MILDIFFSLHCAKRRKNAAGNESRNFSCPQDPSPAIQKFCPLSSPVIHLVSPSSSPNLLLIVESGPLWCAAKADVIG